MGLMDFIIDVLSGREKLETEGKSFLDSLFKKKFATEPMPSIKQLARRAKTDAEKVEVYLLVLADFYDRCFKKLPDDMKVYAVLWLELSGHLTAFWGFQKLFGGFDEVMNNFYRKSPFKELGGSFDLGGPVRYFAPDGSHVLVYFPEQNEVKKLTLEDVDNYLKERGLDMAKYFEAGIEGQFILMEIGYAWEKILEKRIKEKIKQEDQMLMEGKISGEERRRLEKEIQESKEYGKKIKEVFGPIMSKWGYTSRSYVVVDRMLKKIQEMQEQMSR